MLFDVPQNELIKKTAEELKKLIHMPSWAIFVKTGNHKERPPVDPNWWYIRAASILRKVYLAGPIGVSKLRTKYGGKKNRGVKPEKFVKGSGNIIRKILQQLEEAKLIKQDVKGKHKGRVVTPKGASILYSAAKTICGKVSKPNTKKENKETIKEEKKNKPTKEVKEESKEQKQEDKTEKTAPKKQEKQELQKKPETKEKTEEDKNQQSNPKPQKEVKQ